MVTDMSTAKGSEPSSDGEASRGAAAGGTGTRRKLNEQQEREVTRLYAETETPVSEISKRFGIGESSVYRVAQRHGAALRGRTTPAGGARAARPAAAATAPAAAPAAAATTTTRGRRGARGRAAAAATTTAPARAAGTGRGRGRRAAPAAAATTAPTNGRRRVARAAAATRAAAAPTRGRRGRAPGARATAATRTTRATRGGAGRAAASAGRRDFRVSFVAVRVIQASSIADAIRQAEALGATEITSVTRND
jgi:transposase-like protein